jgi:hypothetical protein
MALLMVDLKKKFGSFREVGASNAEVGSDEKLRDSEDPQNELKKRPRKRNQVPIPSLL